MSTSKDCSTCIFGVEEIGNYTDSHCDNSEFIGDSCDGWVESYENKLKQETLRTVRLENTITILEDGINTLEKYSSSIKQKLEQETKRRKEAEKITLSFKDHLEVCSIFIYNEKGCNCGYEAALEYQEKYSKKSTGN